MPCDCCCTAALVGLGALTALVFLYKIVTFVRLNYFTSVNLKKKYSKAGSWAIVTGASEGIGYAFAKDLAKRGFNVCVIARSKDKLQSTVQEIEQLKVKGKAVSFDFSTATAKDYEKLFAELDTLDVALLVNNVGVNYEYANYFDEVAVEEDLRLIKVNCEAMVQMSKYVLNRLKEKKAGGIVNISSFTATTPTPMLATYAGTKSFNMGFSNALHYEAKKHNVDVLTVSPNLTISKMTQGSSTKEPKASFLQVKAAPVARGALNQLGSTMHTSGHVNHGIIESVFGLLPLDFKSNKVLQMHKDVKRRAERKKTQ